MPIKSYILIPHENAIQLLKKEIDVLKGCQLHPAQNKDVLVLVTDTESEEEDKMLMGRIEQSSHLAHISFVSGFEN